MRCRLLLLLFVAACCQAASARTHLPVLSDSVARHILSSGGMALPQLSACGTRLQPEAFASVCPQPVSVLPKQDPAEQFRAKQLILPLSLVAVSSFGLWDDRAKRVNERVRDRFLQWRGAEGVHFDDYVQYVPAASYLLLGVAGAKARHNFKERMVVLGTSWFSMGLLVNAMKYAAREPRPDNPEVRNSYPSGHTATAFMGAELVRREYGAGYGAAAYAVACCIGVMRLYNNRHWLNDVIAGAGIGILSAQIGCWMLPLTRRLFGMKTDAPLLLAAVPFYDVQTQALGAGLSIHLF